MICFNRPAVHEDRNVYGYHSIAVPTQVAGMALAHERFATKSWGDLITPAAELAAGGLPVNWFATLRISAAAKELRQFGPSSEVYLEDGLAPTAVQGKTIPRRGMGNLSATLKRLAEAGARDFYEGALAEKLVADAAAGGSRIAADDLAAVEALERDPLEMEYNGASVFAAPGLTAGPTMFDVLGIINGAITACDGSPSPESYKAYAAALKSAYDQRLETMGDADDP